MKIRDSITGMVELVAAGEVSLSDARRSLAELLDAARQQFPRRPQYEQQLAAALQQLNRLERRP